MAAAATSRRVTLTDLPSDFSLNYLKELEISLKSRQQGFKYFSEGYFENVNLHKSADIIHVSAKCHRSQRKTEQPHSINIDISPGKLDLSHCSCTAGASGCCSHVVGLMTALMQWQMMGLSDVPAVLSSTCFQQQWSIPRGSKITPEAVPHMTIIQPKPNRKQAPMQNKIIDCRKIKVEERDIEHLKSLVNLPISYLALKPTLTIDTHLGQVSIGSGLSTHAKFYEKKHVKAVDTVCGELVFPKQAPLPLPEKYKPLPEDLLISQEKAEELEESTRDQSQCSEWFKARETRITASKFHEVIHRRTITDKYLHKLLYGQNQSCAAMEYGKRKESKARKAYIAKAGNHVHDCGIVVNPVYPYLGATPDGKVCENGETGILEIKCPFSARQMDISEAIALPNFCLEVNETGTRLKENHMYYTQVQGQLLITGAKFCDFVVYTSKETYVERVEPNDEFMSDILSKLTSAYFEYVRPFLVLHK